MGIKAENTRRIRELEAEFSDEKFAEIFRMEDIEEVHIGGRRGRMTKKACIRLLLEIAIPVCCVLVALQFFSMKIVFETSMENTLESRDCVVLAKRAYDSPDAVRFGDIIVHRSHLTGADGLERDLVKRVIGLPGDVIEIRDGRVYRNGEGLDESYVPEGRTEGSFAQCTVPAGCFFVMGDNRQASVDSRDSRVGFVPMDQVAGKVVFRLLPVSHIGNIS